MKKKVLLIAVIIGSITCSYSQEHLKIDITKSELKWSGEYTFYFGGHNGTIQLKEGYFIKTDQVITGGQFLIDMNTMVCLDISEEEANTGLIDHLKGEDFFDVAKFPIAKLVITSVEYHDKTHMKMYANLTAKGITLPINFQAQVDYDKKQLETKFKIDRRQWGINYSSKFKDGAISDGIGFEVKLSL